MNKFGLHTFGLPSFGISDFRLTSFGGDGDGGRKAAFHSSLVDAWFMSGYSNSDKPKEIVGVRGNAIALKNFLYAKNSGFGKYAEDFMEWVYDTSDLNIERTSEKVTIFANEAGGTAYHNFRNTSFKEFNISFKASVDCNLILHTKKFSDSKPLRESTQIIADTLYHMSFETVDESEYSTRWVYFTSPMNCPLTITQIPENEGSLCFDGADDYGSYVGLPLLEDYTVICRREYFKNEGTSCLLSKDSTGSNKDGAFMIERTPTATMSYTRGNSISRNPSNMVIYQTKTSYNGAPLTVGNAVDSDSLNLGCVIPTMGFFNGSIYYFALYNKSLSPKEIEEEKIKLEQKWKSKLK